MEKNITKKENTKETGKKPCEEKLYQSIVFFEEKLVFTCNCNSYPAQYLKNKINKDNFREKHNKTEKTIWKKTL